MARFTASLVQSKIYQFSAVLKIVMVSFKAKKGSQFIYFLVQVRLLTTFNRQGREKIF